MHNVDGYSGGRGINGEGEVMGEQYMQGNWAGGWAGEWRPGTGAKDGEGRPK